MSATQGDMKRAEFLKQLAQLLNSFSEENSSNTPDFILATFIDHCLAAWSDATRAREIWYGVKMRPAQHRPKIVCLCGSTRFYKAFQEANYRETMAGNIVLSVGFYRPSPQSESETTRYHGTHGESWGCTPEQKIALNVLHKQKIDMADEILVLNVGGYIGESTNSEVSHAIANGKGIRWLEPHNIPSSFAHGTKQPD